MKRDYEILKTWCDKCEKNTATDFVENPNPEFPSQKYIAQCKICGENKGYSTHATTCKQQ